MFSRWRYKNTKGRWKTQNLLHNKLYWVSY